MQRILGLVRRCVEDYNMIAEGDRIAVGVSGGKDSLVLLQLLAGQDSLVGVDDDNEIATVNIGGEVGLVLATQQVSDGNGGTAQGLAGSVNNIPLTLQGLLLQKSSGHYGFLQ